MQSVTGKIYNNLNFSSQDFNLSHNYTNPFSASTIIGYQLNTGSFVTIKVYDPIGVEIITLANEEKKPGYYTVQFPSSNDKYSTGIYYVQMKCDNFFQTRKMVITK